VLLKVKLLFEIDILGRVRFLRKPVVRAQQNKPIFYVALIQQLVDTAELLAENMVVDVAHNGRQCRA
jgi:hypothetical protein